MEISSVTVLIVALIIVQSLYVTTGALSQSRFIARSEHTEGLMDKAEQLAVKRGGGVRMAIFIFLYATAGLFGMIGLARLLSNISYQTMMNVFLACQSWAYLVRTLTQRDT